MPATASNYKVNKVGWVKVRVTKKNPESRPFHTERDSRQVLAKSYTWLRHTRLSNDRQVQKGEPILTRISSTPTHPIAREWIYSYKHTGIIYFLNTRHRNSETSCRAQRPHVLETWSTQPVKAVDVDPLYTPDDSIL